MYLTADGAPKYGIRTLVDPEPVGAAILTVSPDAVVREAALLDAPRLAAAIDRRLVAAWADQEDPLVTHLRCEHPEELAEAQTTVSTELGTARQWQKNASKRFYRNLASVNERRRGKANAATAARVALFALLFIPPLLVVAYEGPLALLLGAGVTSCVLAFVLGEVITARLRLPMAPKIRLPWLRELHRDVEDAVLLAILQRKGIVVDSKTATAMRRGWDSLKDE